jgi:glycosyltransferase involved in cell wall biosynthesis
MKILFVSMPSIHVLRWIENLKDTSNELYWFDVLDRGKIDTLDSVLQFTEWKKRKIPYIKGEYYLKKRKPNLYKKIAPYLETTANEALEKIILEIQPDIVHSFELQTCSLPILKTMEKFSEIKWLYSCWGTDIYKYQNSHSHIKNISKLLNRVNFLHTDCLRDFKLAARFGFSGKFLGVVPGGAGFKINQLQRFALPLHERKIILIKGYQHYHGRGLNVIKAIELLKSHIDNKYEIIVFGAHPHVISYINSQELNFKVYAQNSITHTELLKLMGKTLLYIGNSVSDGIPNTLLEAIVMGAFPIQSNPGGASAEIIKHNINGLLIENAENIDEIRELIFYFLENLSINSKARTFNSNLAIERLDYAINQKKIINMYDCIINS